MNDRTESLLHAAQSTRSAPQGPPSARAAILALVFCLATSAAGAQGGWLPRSVAMGPNLTGANRAAAIARLESVERILKQVPELAHPNGFEIRPFFTGHRSRLGLNGSEHADYVVEYQYRIHFFVPKFTPDTPAIGIIVFMVNGKEDDPGFVDPQGRDIMIERARWPLVPFSVVTYGVSASGGLQAGEDFSSSVWLTAGGELPWRAVSREDYYTAMIASAEGNNGERRARFDKAHEKTGYQHWLEEAPQRKKDREEVLKGVAAVQPPTEVAKLRKALEDAEREAGEEFKKSEGEDREQAKTTFKSTDDMRIELERMTPAQRKMPAILDDDPARTEWRTTGASLRDQDDALSPGVHRVLTPNYDFWRMRTSVADPRTIHVYFEGTSNPPVLNAVYQAYKKLDWRALRALLDQPTRERP